MPADAVCPTISPGGFTLQSELIPPPAPPDAVDLRGLRFAWERGQPVLDLPDLCVGARERVFVLGPSGSGKSTLLSLIAGVMAPGAGSLTVLGEPFHQLSAASRDAVRADRIGVIFQLFNLVPYLGAVDNVLLPLSFSPARAARVAASGRSARDEAIRLLDHLGLGPEARRRNTTRLSVGQQQRVAAARALIGSPGLVIADEPTSALDTAARDRFIDLLMSECRAADAALLFVSHDRSLARRFDREIDLAAINRAETEGGMT